MQTRLERSKAQRLHSHVLVKKVLKKKVSKLQSRHCSVLKIYSLYGSVKIHVLRPELK